MSDPSTTASPRRPVPEVHGHRGCRGLRPENTLSGFLHALALGVDALEMDVVVSTDGQVVVSHEPWLAASLCLDPDGRPIAPEAERRHNLYRMPYAVIRRCEVGLLPQPNFPEQQLAPAYKPLLREVLAAVESATQQLGRPPVHYAVELKSTPEGDNLYHPAPAAFVSLVADELHRAGVLSRTTLLSFDLRVLQVARRLLPMPPLLCLLTEDEQPWTVHFQHLGFAPDTFGPDFVTLSPGAVRELRAAHPRLRLVPWTVNEPADLRRALALQPDGITTDYPDRLLAMRRV